MSHSLEFGESRDVLLWNGPERILLQIQMMGAMDTKVGVVLGFSVVSMAEMLGFLVLAATEKNASSSPLFTTRVVVPLSLGFLAGIAACLVSIFILLTKQVEIGPSFGWRPPAGEESKLLDVWKGYISKNEGTLKTKGRLANLCIGLALGQMTSYGLAAFVLFLKFVPAGDARHYPPCHFFF